MPFAILSPPWFFQLSTSVPRWTSPERKGIKVVHFVIIWSPFFLLFTFITLKGSFFRLSAVFIGIVIRVYVTIACFAWLLFTFMGMGVHFYWDIVHFYWDRGVVSMNHPNGCWVRFLSSNFRTSHSFFKLFTAKIFDCMVLEQDRFISSVLYSSYW